MEIVFVGQCEVFVCLCFCKCFFSWPPPSFSLIYGVGDGFGDSFCRAV